MEGILYRYRCGIAWTGPGSPCGNGTGATARTGPRGRILAALLTDTQKVGVIDWAVSVDVS